MSNKTDRTKLHIIETFFSMMDEIGFEKITVANLSKQAKINRGTFYHHFPDKYAVLEEVEEEIYANFAQVLNDHVGWAVTEKNRCLWTDARRAIFQGSVSGCDEFLIRTKRDGSNLAWRAWASTFY